MFPTSPTCSIFIFGLKSFSRCPHISICMNIQHYGSHKDGETYAHVVCFDAANIFMPLQKLSLPQLLIPTILFSHHLQCHLLAQALENFLFFMSGYKIVFFLFLFLFFFFFFFFMQSASFFNINFDTQMFSLNP